MASWQSKAVHFGFQLLGVKRSYQSLNPPYLRMRRRNFAPSPDIFTSQNIGHGRIWKLVRPSVSAPRVLIWFHGGGYCLGPFEQQFRALQHLCQATGSQGYLLDYPKAPEFQFEHAQEFVNLALKWVEDHHPQSTMIWLGDSSGAGLMISRAVRLQPSSLRLMIAISPWVDLSMSQPGLDSLEVRDPFLSRPGVLTFAKWFAGKRSLQDPELSPLFLEPIKFKFPVYMVSGTEDILDPQIRQFFEKQKTCNPQLRLEVGANLLHVWPLMPIPEAKAIKEQWIQIIQAIN